MKLFVNAIRQKLTAPKLQEKDELRGCILLANNNLIFAIKKNQPPQASLYELNTSDMIINEISLFQHDIYHLFICGSDFVGFINPSTFSIDFLHVQSKQITNQPNGCQIIRLPTEEFVKGDCPVGDLYFSKHVQINYIPQTQDLLVLESSINKNHHILTSYDKQHQLRKSMTLNSNNEGVIAFSLFSYKFMVIIEQNQPQKVFSFHLYDSQCCILKDIILEVKHENTTIVSVKGWTDENGFQIFFFGNGQMSKWALLHIYEVNQNIFKVVVLPKLSDKQYICECYLTDSGKKQLWLYFLLDGGTFKKPYSVNSKYDGHSTFLSIYDVSRGFHKFKLIDVRHYLESSVLDILVNENDGTFVEVPLQYLDIDRLPVENKAQSIQAKDQLKNSFIYMNRQVSVPTRIFHNLYYTGAFELYDISTIEACFGMICKQE